MTEVYFSFDTEDFTSDHAADAIRDQADILAEYGVRGNFNIVGFLARELVRNRRFDVLDALKAHTVSFHSLAHSYHPTINEYTDMEDHDLAERLLRDWESEGMGMVRAATGLEGNFMAACPPGNSFSYVAMYAYADWNIPLYVGSLFNTPDGHGVYYCNQFHTDYNYAMESLFIENGSYDQQAFIEEIARMKRVFLYNHPNKVLYEKFWDAVNYNKENLHPMHAWEEPPRRSPEAVALYYKRLRGLIEALQKDGRFRIGSAEELAKKTDVPRTVTKDMLPEIERKLKEKFSWIDSPVSLSVADCFYAAKHFLDSDEPYKPGCVHGFLEAPVGADHPVTLSAADIRRLAGETDPRRFLPRCFCVNGETVGAADLLFAMLAAANGADTYTVQPREQQCDYSSYPALKNIHLRGTWLHSDEFRDAYLSDRLRLQAWTIRPET